LRLVSYKPGWSCCHKVLFSLSLTDTGPLRGVSIQVGPWWLASLQWETGKS
jgi:hypothetical protein